MKANFTCLVNSNNSFYNMVTQNFELLIGFRKDTP